MSSDERKAAIIEAAVKVIQQVGYARLTARKIAEHPNIALGHITYNFKDMNEILVETYRYTSKQLVDTVYSEIEFNDETPLENLRNFLSIFFKPDFLKKDFLRLRIDLWSAALASEEIMSTERALYDRYRSVLSSLISKIALHRRQGVENVPLLVDAVTSLQDGLWLDWERRHDERTIENGLNACIILVNSMLPEAK